MISKSIYLKRYATSKQYVLHAPATDLGLVVVIPCCNEVHIVKTLESLWRCAPIDASIEVLLVINNGIKAATHIIEQNRRTYEEVTHWYAQQNRADIVLHLLQVEDMPVKHAGVGLARKTGMDEAVRRFEALEKDGLIACIDADCTCEPNYFEVIVEHFENRPQTPAGIIYYEHPIDEQHEKDLREGIILYELHLRYYVNAQRYAGFYHAHQTLGSCMVVRSRDYQKQGGMNRRKAGEDFYFLHKFICQGQFSEINNTVVYPAGRVSTRVPFGTGRAMNNWLQSDSRTYQSYNLKTFTALREFLCEVSAFYSWDIPQIEAFLKSLPENVCHFLVDQEFSRNLEEIKKQSASYSIFENRFFRWFDAFLLMKYVHYSRDNYYEDGAVELQSKALLKLLFPKMDLHDLNPLQLLGCYRNLDREGTIHQ